MAVADDEPILLAEVAAELVRGIPGYPSLGSAAAGGWLKQVELQELPEIVARTGSPSACRAPASPRRNARNEPKTAAAFCITIRRMQHRLAQATTVFTRPLLRLRRPRSLRSSVRGRCIRRSAVRDGEARAEWWRVHSEARPIGGRGLALPVPQSWIRNNSPGHPASLS
jgi:hypothetical protein